MDVYFLGTGAGTPSRERNVSSLSLNLFAERGVFWLFDCGEGTQHQLLNSPLKLSKCEKIFITHLHGDHIYGLPGLLTSRSHQGATLALTLYGPKGLRSFVEGCLSVSQAQLNYDLTYVEYSEGVIFSDEQFTVEAALLEHRIDSYGFRITERDKPGRLKAEQLEAIGVKPGPIYSKIKAGHNMTLEDGRVIKAADYLAPPQPGRVIAIIGDTRRCEAAEKLAQHADLLVHEATFGEEYKHLAYEYYHSTTVDAATIAKNNRVNKLIMTHISTRYQSSDSERLLLEARNIHANTFLAKDFTSFIVPRQLA